MEPNVSWQERLAKVFKDNETRRKQLPHLIHDDESGSLTDDDIREGLYQLNRQSGVWRT